jgi:hypothetical protein
MYDFVWRRSAILLGEVKESILGDRSEYFALLGSRLARVNHDETGRQNRGNDG